MVPNPRHSCLNVTLVVSWLLRTCIRDQFSISAEVSGMCDGMYYCGCRYCRPTVPNCRSTFKWRETCTVRRQILEWKQRIPYILVEIASTFSIASVIKCQRTVGLIIFKGYTKQSEQSQPSIFHIELCLITRKRNAIFCHPSKSRFSGPSQIVCSSVEFLATASGLNVRQLLFSIKYHFRCLTRTLLVP